MNESIMQLISSDSAVAHWAYRELRKKWPQINEYTQINFTNQSVVYLEKMTPQTVMEPVKWVALSGWERLKRALFPYAWQDMDDPHQRMTYQAALWQSLFTMFAPRFWRIAGAVFHSDKWVKRGMEVSPVSSVMPQPSITEEIRLEIFSWQTRGWGYEPDYLRCGYYGRTDTLYIYRGDNP